MKKLLWIGDAGCQSGFAKSTHGILASLPYTWEISVLGINYRGDPYDRVLYPYDMWVAAAGGDWMGVGRVEEMCKRVKPDLIVIQQDGWNFQHYIKELRQLPEYAKVPVVAIVAVDGKNFNGKWLDGVSAAIFWTQFALDEARAGGYDGPASVIPLGVDRSIYRPLDKTKCRKALMMNSEMFVVGNVNRNQPRKRWDLTLRYFAEWMKTYGPKNAFLYLHAAPTGDTTCDILNLAKYYGIYNNIIFMEPTLFYGLDEEGMAVTYNCFDVQISTTQGEGFGLTILEGMACAVPPIVPDWAALGEWTKDAAWLVRCSSTAIGPPYVNVIGGVPDEKEFIQALQRMYCDKEGRAQNAQAAIERASERRFEWGVIGEQVAGVLEQVVAPVLEEQPPERPTMPPNRVIKEGDEVGPKELTL